MSLIDSKDFYAIDIPPYGRRLGFKDGMAKADTVVKPIMRKLVEGKATVGVIIPVERDRYEDRNNRLLENFQIHSVTTGYFIGLMEALAVELRQKYFPQLKTGLNIPDRSKTQSTNAFERVQGHVLNIVSLRGDFDKIRNENSGLEKEILKRVKMVSVQDEDYRVAEFDHRRLPVRFDMALEMHASLCTMSVPFFSAMDAMYVSNLRAREDFVENGEVAAEGRLASHPGPRPF